jgi:serine-type D-Ala-D-Ala carboxypeptidase (penicillin-binding protein 5/6)
VLTSEGRGRSAVAALSWVFAVMAVLAGLAGPASAQSPTGPTAPPAKVAPPPSSAYVLVDINTGNVLAGYHEHLRLPPASLTKILTALIAVTFLPPAARVKGTVQSLDAYPNIVGIEKGVAWPLNDVLQALLVYSANDAAYAIAQRISGTLTAFGPVMDRSARQIGMSDDPVFHDPAGLDGTEGVDGGNLVSARDLAIAGRDLLHVPELARIVKQESAGFIDPTGAAHDLPSMDYAFLSTYPGAIGLKTGFTDRAGSCIMAAATRHGRTMLVVVMNGYNTTQSAVDLLNQGFATPVAAEPKKDRLPPVALPRPASSQPARPGPSRVTTKAHKSPAHGTVRPARTVKHPATVKHRMTVKHPMTVTAPSRAPTGQRGAPGATARPSTSGPGNVPSNQARAAISHPRTGLAAVVRSWPGETLLLVAGLGALLALWELVSTHRLYRRRRQARDYTSGPSVMGNLSSSRKRREQLIASYRRHERPDSVRRSSSIGRR